VHGTCDEGVSGTGACSCDSGWTGTNCDTPSPSDAGADSSGDASDGATHGTPYSGTPLPFGTSTQVEAEKYDVGGEGISYHDTTAGNALAQYRNDDVDIEQACGGTTCYDVSMIEAGEWTEYTINVTTTADYSIQLGYSAASIRHMHIELDGVDVTGPISPTPSTDAGPKFTGYNVPGAPVHFTAGVHVMRWVFDDGGLSMNWIKFTRQTG
jgi:hypothetical protein